MVDALPLDGSELTLVRVRIPSPAFRQHNHYRRLARIMKSSDTSGVARTGDNIHIPLKTDDALRLALKVKPTKDMPRSGQANYKKKPKQTKRKRA
jgi:hypothetical protein